MCSPSMDIIDLKIANLKGNFRRGESLSCTEGISFEGVSFMHIYIGTYICDVRLRSMCTYVQRCIYIEVYVYP